jgi:hypothetical protein
MRPKQASSISLSHSFPLVGGFYLFITAGYWKVQMMCELSLSVFYVGTNNYTPSDVMDDILDVPVTAVGYNCRNS